MLQEPKGQGGEGHRVQGLQDALQFSEWTQRGCETHMPDLLKSQPQGRLHKRLGALRLPAGLYEAGVCRGRRKRWGERAGVREGTKTAASYAPSDNPQWPPTDPKREALCDVLVWGRAVKKPEAPSYFVKVHISSWSGSGSGMPSPPEGQVRSNST